ncbi:MAG: CHAT domain-containing protein, partial [Defluviicoccus sp.]
GLAGSTLSVAGAPIWPDLRCLAAGGFTRLESDAAGVAAGQLLDRPYGELCRTLERTHDVRPFAYDWRLSIEETGAGLARALDQALGSQSQPVRIVAHGMGGLLARTAFATNSAVWDAFRSRAGCRLIMLGTPHDGTHASAMMLMGRDRLMRMLAMIDVTAGARDHAQILARFPGVLQLLPRDAGFDLFSAEAWQRLHALDPARSSWVVPRAEDLEKAKAFRDRYRHLPFDAERMVSIAGEAATPCEIVIETPPSTPARIVFAQTWEGDGQVPWSTGIVAGATRRWYACCRHGDLPRDGSVLAALGEILDQGTTTGLAAQPASARERSQPAPVVRETVALFPAAADLEAAAAGGTVQPPARPGLAPLTIAVLHGNLAFAAYPVLVGHYNGDTLNGPEGHLNRLLDGRLEMRRALGFYPGALGTAEVILDENARPEGAVVVGLGDPGSLDPADLERTLVDGLLRYAVVQTERRCGVAANGVSPSPLRLSLLLVGAGEGGLTVETCVKAVSQAIVRAQRALTDSNPAARVYDRIEIIELYEHRAIDIWHALNDLLAADASGERPLQLVPEISRRDGGRRRVRSEHDRSWWQPVQVSMDVVAGEYLLKVATSAGRARVEATTVYGTVEMARRLSEQAKRDKAGGPAVETPGRGLYELLWPNRLKSEGFGDRNLRLILDERAASLPWELLDDRRSWDAALARNANPPAIRAGLVRQLVQQRYREQTGSTAGRRQALVIGDPRGDPAREYKPLQGALEEAADVATLLQSKGYAVTRLIGDQVFPEQVISALLSERWQIVHIAAHGDVEHEIAVNAPIVGDTGAAGLQRTRKATGIVLGRNLFLEPSMLEQMPVAPDLFFVNCCHVGGIDADREAALAARRPELAASIAVQLIRMGVRGVVAAGWAVNDRLARAFATQFYQGFLASQEFGRAVRTAREAVYRQSPTDPTWGAYQCYGEPDWRLGAASQEGGDDEPLIFAAPAEAITEIERVREDAQTVSERDLGTLKQRLDSIRHDAIAACEARRSWLASAEMASAFAKAYAELGAIDQAIADYERALKANRGSAAVRDIEQLADLRVRKAVLTAAGGDGAAPDAAKEIRAAIQALTRLTALGRTAERYGLIGTAYKRLATIVGPEEVAATLIAMQKAFEKAAAHEQSEAAAAGGRAVQRVDRPLLVQAAHVARALHRGDPVAPEVVDAINECRRDAESADSEQPCFWHGAAIADTALLAALAAALVKAAETGAPPILQGLEADVIAALYGKARRRGGSPLKLSSASEQLDFFITIVGHSPIAAEARRDLVQALARIRDCLLP